MLSVTEKFVRLKTSIPGNREASCYEDTFGATKEELAGITAVSKFTRRIIAELEFSIKLSASLSNKYDSKIHEALDYLLCEVAENGVITNAAALKAEKTLLPLCADAKEYKLIFVGHAHIDMNWMWSWNETVAATLATFRTVLNLMDEYPEFCFSQSQASVYKIVEDYEPAMMDEIKKRIDEGRWEITASSWVETDKNMPNTESLLRHIKYTKNYLRDSWEVNPDSLNIDFSPDTFGHSANLPEIDLQGGVKYYYHCRGLDGDDALYRWRGQSGRELLVYREQYWYNAAVTPKPCIGIIDVARRSAGLKTGLAVFGVGDHGGGPTRRDIENTIEMMAWPVFPTVKFGTLKEFFLAAESVKNELKVITHELNFTFPGCYTTQSRIKFGNRRCEAALTDAEALNAFAVIKAEGRESELAFEKAWRDVLFTHFHDILTGSCVQDSREHAMGLYQNSLAVAQTEYSAAMRSISQAVDTSPLFTDEDISSSQAEGAGAGYNSSDFGVTPSAERGGGLTRIFNIFNPTPVDKAQCVEINVWDWPGDLRRVKVSDKDGNPVQFQLIDTEMQKFWDHRYFRILLFVELDALAYTTVVIGQGEIEGGYPLYYQHSVRTNKPNTDFVLDNGRICAKFDYKTGDMISLTDSHGTQYIANGGRAGFAVVETESDTSNAWHIGRYLRDSAANAVIEIHSTYSGELRNGFEFTAKVKGSTIKAQVYLDKNAPCVTIKTEVDWNEVGGETIPVLVYAADISYKADRYAYNIPGGSIEREPMELDVPALSYAAAVSGKHKNAAIITDSKYGFRGCADGRLISTLINTSTSPDPYPERGIHKIGLCMGVFDADPCAMESCAVSEMRRMSYQPVTAHEGTLPLSGKLFESKLEQAVISSVLYENDALYIRLIAPSDQIGRASFKFDRNVCSAFAVDLMDNAVSSNASSSGNEVTTLIPAHSILTLQITL